jgi:succinate dehydrogenase / fumarate reductase flavoprotein subunit
LSDLLVFGQRAGEYAAAFAAKAAPGTIDVAAVNEAAQEALAPFERAEGGEGAFQIQNDLQGSMQELVGIVRRESEMEEALEVIGKLRERAAGVGVPGNREYNPGWHTALDLGNMLTVSEAVTRAALERKESRGAQFRDDYQQKDDRYGTFNIVIRKAADGSMALSREPVTPMRDELKQIIEEMK